jgi:hypothetical protein
MKNESARSARFGSVPARRQWLALVVLVAACGGSSSISGEYMGQPGSWVDKLVFGPGNEVRAIDGGDTAAGIFSIDGKEVLLTFGTDRNKLTITGNGCLDGGRDAGIYCKR